MKRSLLALAAGCALSLALLSAHGAEPRTVTVARGLQNPWALAFLPDGRMLVTEKAGRLRIVAADGTVGKPLAGLPKVDAGGQGGLLDVVVDPRFADNRRLYWSYSEPGDGNLNGTAVARGTLQGDGLTDVKVIFRQLPKHSGGSHFGSRLVFDRSGALFVTLGDRFSLKDDAQVLGNHIGKIVRITPDGEPAPDNPFTGPAAKAEAKPEVWSYGHRNVQGAALHPTTGELWATEHGPQGGDELNRVEKGRNHGWPVITYGRNYGLGTRIGEGEAREDVVAPLRHWVPVSIAPSGLAFLTSDRYPGWQGDLFMGALRGQALLRLQLDGDRVVGEERLLTRLGERIRDVRQGPDGWLYVLTDNADGRILRLQP